MTTDENALALLREIRDIAFRQEKYFADRDKAVSEQIAADAKRQLKLGASFHVVISALMIAMWVIAVVQILNYFRSTH